MVEVQGGKLKKFLIKQFLPLGFVIAVAWALLWYQPGKWCYTLYVGHWKIISTINIMIIFLIFGLTLETSELKMALKAVKVWGMGMITILCLTALWGFAFINMGFEPREFGVGLAIFACSPTALSSGISLVVAAYGSGAISLLLTVASNLAGIVISPIFVGWVLGPMGNINKIDLLVKLLVQILAPLLAGKFLRECVPPVLRFSKKYKVHLYLLNNFQIVLIVWQTLSASRNKLLNQKLYDIILAIMGAVGQHMLFLVMNFIIAFIMRFKEADKKAFIVSSSQKSLPTAAVIIESIKIDKSDPDALDAGLIAIPCMVFYVMQLFIDAFITNGWAGKYERADMLRAKFADELAELYKIDDPETTIFLHMPTPHPSTVNLAAAARASAAASASAADTPLAAPAAAPAEAATPAAPAATDGAAAIQPPPAYEEKIGLLSGSAN